MTIMTNDRKAFRSILNWAMAEKIRIKVCKHAGWYTVEEI